MSDRSDNLQTAADTDLQSLQRRISELEQSNRELRSQLDSGAPMATSEALRRLKDISDAIVAGLELDRVLQLVAEQTRELIGAETIIIPIISEDRQEYHYVAAAGRHAAEIIDTRFPIHIGMCGWVLTREQPLIFGEDMPFALDESTRWEQGQTSALLVPLLGKQRIIGGLSALGKRNGRSFTRSDLDLLTLFANQVSVAIENASLVTQLREALEHLEQRVEERTTELRAINQELESFCYSASHDLRTPLRGIDGFSHILLEDYHSLLDDRGREYLQRIRAGSQLMGKLIDDMLRLSRVSLCKLRITQTDLSPIVARIVARRRQDAPQRDIDVDIEPHLVCYGDEALLVIALENLISNAWKFTGRSPRPRIEVGRQSGDHSTFFVRDNGCGFNTRYGDKLFKPFERLHNERDYPGTGVGLAIVERIIRRHGGSIRAQCGEGTTTFCFSLPAGPESAPRKT